MVRAGTDIVVPYRSLILARDKELHKILSVQYA